MTGTVGTGDPRYTALRTHVNGLLGTALMQAHVGARGGERIMEHFQDIANAGKMSRDTLQAALDAEKEYVNDKAMRPTAKVNNTTQAAPMVMFQDSKGQPWTIPADKLDAAKQRDPNLRVIQ